MGRQFVNIDQFFGCAHLVEIIDRLLQELLINFFNFLIALAVIFDFLGLMNPEVAQMSLCRAECDKSAG